MAPRHFLHEAPQRLQHVRERLAGTWFRIKRDEVNGMAAMQRDTDFGVGLEAADAWAMSGTRIDDHHGRPGGIQAVFDAVVPGPRDAKERVVGRMLEAPGIEQRFVVEVQQRRLARALVGDHVVGPLAQCVPEQHRALEHVTRVAHCLSEVVHGRTCKRLFGGMICRHRRHGCHG